jgi:hypothetical protein
MSSFFVILNWVLELFMFNGIKTLMHVYKYTCEGQSFFALLRYAQIMDISYHNLVWTFEGKK